MAFSLFGCKYCGGPLHWHKPHPHPNFSWLPWITIASPQICLGLESLRSLTQLCLYPLIDSASCTTHKTLVKEPLRRQWSWKHFFLWMRNHNYIPFFAWKKPQFFIFLWIKNLNCISFFGWKPQLHSLWREPKNIHTREDNGNNWSTLHLVWDFLISQSLVWMGFSKQALLSLWVSYSLWCKKQLIILRWFLTQFWRSSSISLTYWHVELYICLWNANCMKSVYIILLLRKPIWKMDCSKLS